MATAYKNKYTSKGFGKAKFGQAVFGGKGNTPYKKKISKETTYSNKY